MSNELLSDFTEQEKVYEFNIGKTFQKESKYSYNQFKCNNFFCFHLSKKLIT
jgi:hypothetical protein